MNFDNERNEKYHIIESKQKEELHMVDSIDKKKIMSERLLIDLEKANNDIKSLNSELKTDFNVNWTDKEQKELIAIDAEYEKAKAEFNAFSIEYNKLETQIGALKNKLYSFLIPQKSQLTRQLESLDYELLGSSNTEESNIKTKAGNLAKYKKTLRDINKNIADLEKEAEKNTSQLDELKINSLMELDQSKNDKFRKRYKVMVYKQQELNKNITQLGLLSEEWTEKYSSKTNDQIMKKLSKIKDSLQKLQHVNKKALEQYGNFSLERDKLLTRKSDIDKVSKSIQGLINTLDMRKDEAIERTFKQVAKFFELIFRRLVPGGNGKLIMQRKIDQDLTKMSKEQTQSIENYVGISIKVSFTGGIDQGLKMNQLSGGQKSLVALALIFSIQKSDPAPFYLFDEIDANLDTAYRTSVADMIHELSEDAQFITTTFRPELLSRAHKFYGVTFADKVSSIDPVSKKEAMKFVSIDELVNP